MSLAGSAAAMGLQASALTRVGSLTVHTTFVTGMLNKLAQAILRILFHSYDVWRKRPGEHRKKRLAEAHTAMFLAGVWLCYLDGAARRRRALPGLAIARAIRHADRAGSGNCGRCGVAIFGCR